MKNGFGEYCIRDTKYESILKEVIESRSLVSIVKYCEVSHMRKVLGTIKKGQDKSILYFLVDEGKIVYIGATYFSNRIFAHCRGDEPKQYDTVIYLVCNGCTAFYMETQLIKAFPTKYNNCKIANKSHFKIVYDER